jgi:DNA-directed RNA polymerase subunit RPC12/RpoP
MGIITDILKDIPLTAILRERLADKEAEMTTLKSENTILKSENAILKAENADLKAKLQKIESDKTVHGDSCPYCQQPKGKLLDIRPAKVLGDLGLKIRYYKCENCDREYDKEQIPQTY